MGRGSSWVVEFEAGEGFSGGEIGGLRELVIVRPQLERLAEEQEQKGEKTGGELHDAAEIMGISGRIEVPSFRGFGGIKRRLLAAGQVGGDALTGRYGPRIL